MKKEILFLLHIPPPIHGSSVVGLIIKESLIINKEFNCSYINLLASKNVSESGIVSFNKILAFLGTFYEVFVSLIRKRPQLCYIAFSTTGAAFYKDLILVALLKVFRIKLIYHLHNKGVSRYQHKIFNHLCYSFAFRNSEVILLSNKLYSDIQSFVPFSKVHICPNGIKDEFSISLTLKRSIDSNPLSLIDRETQNSEKKVRILFLSNLLEKKGVFVLLEACALLMRKGVPFECVFIGGEGNITVSQLNEKINQLGLKNQVNYQGKKFGAEKNTAYTETDIFVFPTFHETFGLVNLEAMQFSIPIISTIEGGIPDVIEDGTTGFLILPKDAQVLAEKIELLIKNPALRHQMGKAGREKYEKEFTQEIFENRLTKILTQISEKEQV